MASDGLKGTASDGSPTSPQSMTDASKRRLTDEGWEAVIEENYVFSSLTPPPYPQAGSSHGREFENDLAEFPLPAGVRSMEEWGKTLFTFGIHKAAGASYEEVAAEGLCEVVSLPLEDKFRWPSRLVSLPSQSAGARSPWWIGD